MANTPLTRDKNKPPSAEFIKWLLDNNMADEAKKLEAQFSEEINKQLNKPGKLVQSIGSTHTELALNKFITVDSQMNWLKEKIRKLAVVPDPVIIYGETGTGKELLANALHGPRAGKFVDINCAGMPENLIESELFGARRGAYTGADRESDGLLEAAKDGTIFLDELGELSFNLQAKLLRAIQEKKIRKVGGTESINISCRFIAATHQPIKKMVEEGTFRRDLYARLSVFELSTTPLLSRLSDCDLIAKSLCSTFPSGVDWSQVDLSTNVRSIQRVVRRWEVLGIVPGITI